MPLGLSEMHHIIERPKKQVSTVQPGKDKKLTHNAMALLAIFHHPILETRR